MLAGQAPQAEPAVRSRNELVARGSPTQRAHMSTYGQFCPVALGAEIFAERWTPLILRELLAGGRRFSDIHRGVPRISRNLLVQRLNSLRRAGIIDRQAAPSGRGHEYRLSDAGRELGPVIDALGAWGYKWASKDLTDDKLDPTFLMWALRRMVRVDELPETRVVVEFRFRRYIDRHFWLVMQRPTVDLCLFDPGFEVDVTVMAKVETLAQVCLGRIGLQHAVRAGDVELSGRLSERRALYHWLGVSRFAATSREG
jgi:DNA-binding HxlR family transcriptional regulator